MMISLRARLRRGEFTGHTDAAQDGRCGDVEATIVFGVFALDPEQR